MDNSYHQQTSSGENPYSAYSRGYQETPRLDGMQVSSQTTPVQTHWAPSPGTVQPNYMAPPWTPPPGYVDHSLNAPGTRGPEGAWGYHFNNPPAAFNPPFLPPAFNCPPPGHLDNTVLPPGFTPPNSLPPFGAAPPPGPCAGYQLPVNAGEFRQQVNDRGLAPPTDSEDQSVVRRREDTRWLSSFLQSRVKGGKDKQAPQQQQQGSEINSVHGLREVLYGAVKLLTAVEKSLQSMKDNVDNDVVWSDSYPAALDMKKELTDKLNHIGSKEFLTKCKATVSGLAKRRARARRAVQQRRQEQRDRKEEICKKEAAIDVWRMKLMSEVDEKMKEQELKKTADSVLCEVRKKQADVNRMLDIMRSLEKLRRLRKEAASRKGITTEQECETTFNSQLESLRGLMKRRTAIYSAEETALMVMLEGEQEEERRREQERKLKKERETQLKKKRKVDAMLFGDELSFGPVLLPYTEYHTQAQHSLEALVQVRREWDMFLVSAEHPDGSHVPQNWILPDAPSHPHWASALQMSEQTEIE